MTSGFEAAGDAFTGGLIGRAIEPLHGEDAIGADGNTHEHACLNCRTPLIGTFCHACGQHAHVHRTIFAIFHDILHGVFHFEGKVWRTVPLLFWNPGDITRRYIHGERARFVSPLALFLFSVFLMFATFESIGGPIRPTVNTNRNGQTMAPAELKAELAKAQAKVAALEERRKAAIAANQSVGSIDDDLDDARGEVTGLAAARGFESSDGPIQPTSNASQNGQNPAPEQLKTELAKAQAKVATLEERRKAAIAARQSVVDIDKDLEDAHGDVMGLVAASKIADGVTVEDLPEALPKGTHVNIGWAQLDDQVNKALKNPKLLLYKLQSAAYKFSWALIPLSLPFMWLMFAWKREYKLYDHAVFVTYSLSFITLLLVVMSCVAALGGPSGVGLIAVPVHFFWQLRRAYQLSAFGAGWRTIVLLFVAAIVSILFSILLLLLGLSG